VPYQSGLIILDYLGGEAGAQGFVGGPADGGDMGRVRQVLPRWRAGWLGDFACRQISQPSVLGFGDGAADNGTHHLVAFSPEAWQRMRNAA